MTIPMIDSHLDLSWCALSWDRELTLPLDKLREIDACVQDDDARGHATISLPELRKANMVVSLGTVLARAKPDPKMPQRGGGADPSNAFRGARRIDLDHGSQNIAYAMAQGQLAYYRILEHQGHIRMIRTRSELDAHFKQWTEQDGQSNDRVPLGLILAMEGADPIINPDHAEQWFADGLRLAGPVHYGRSVYAVGTGDDGPLTSKGIELLRKFEQLGMIVDMTHLSDTSFFETLDVFAGRVLASHHNCRALVPGDRQLSDEQIKRLIERDAVIGSALDAWMLYPGWKSGVTKPDVVGLEAVADHMDHICQLAGNARHIAIGTDLDGGFGYEQTVRDVNGISDMQKLAPILKGRGYSDADVAGVFHGNWLRLFREALPQ